MLRFNAWKLAWTGLLTYLRYRYGGSMPYFYRGNRGTIAYGPHALRGNWESNLKLLKAIGISELHVHWSFVTRYNQFELVRIPTISATRMAQVDHAKKLGMKVTAQIRWNPDRKSMPELPKGYPFWWWSGFVWFDEDGQRRFFDANRHFLDQLHEMISPDEVILSNEMAQGIHFNPSGWVGLIRHAKQLGMKTAVALNTWQPLKFDPGIRYLMRRLDVEKLAPMIFRWLELPYPESVLDGKNLKRMLRHLPTWLNQLDSVGINSYHPTTFNVRSASKIRRMYAPFGWSIKKMDTWLTRPITCTETGLELETGVDRSVSTATNWWKETLDFWFKGLNAKRILVWEHDLALFLKVVNRLGGLERWTE